MWDLGLHSVKDEVSTPSPNLPIVHNIFLAIQCLKNVSKMKTSNFGAFLTSNRLGANLKRILANEDGLVFSYV